MDDGHQDEREDGGASTEQPSFIARRGDDLAADVDELVQVAAAATGPNDEDLRDRREVVEQHARHPDAVGILALHDERLIGFVYGTRSEPGQRWHDHLSAALSPAQRDRWTRRAFAIRELAVIPSARDDRISQELLERLLTRPEAQQHQVVLLSSPMDDPVEPLARRLGFEDIITSLPFMPDGPPCRVMGRETTPR